MSEVRTIEGIELPAPGEWALDAAHTTVGFTARHLMVTKVRGRFEDFTGTVHVTEDPLASWVEVEISTPSIVTGSEQRDQHLKSPDFLDVETFPAMTFRSTKLEPTGGRSFRLHGDLTIRDVTEPVVLEGEFLGLVGDPWGGTRAGFTASTEIDRERWGMTWNVAMETGGLLVSKKVQLELEVQLVPAAASQAA